MLILLATVQYSVIYTASFTCQFCQSGCFQTVKADDVLMHILLSDFLVYS